jgi:hypothetical protein
MLNQVLGPLVLRRVVQEIPDTRVLPYGGPWGQRIADVPATHDELVEYDRNIPPAADLVPYGAQTRDVVERPTELVQHKAFQIRSSNRLDQGQMAKVIALVESGGVSATLKQDVLGFAKARIERRLQSIAITRGILLAGMACGELSWSQGGYVQGAIDFGMPAALKCVPTTYWRASNGTINVNATPVTNLTAMDIEAERLGGSAFTDLDLSRSSFNAMIATTEYQTHAKSRLAVVNIASLPVAGTQESVALASSVLGKTIRIVDATFEYELSDASRVSGRYVPETYAVLWRSEGLAAGADFANVPVTQSAVAVIGEDGRFGGVIVRGPVPFMTCDNDLTWVRLNGVQEGTPRRHMRAVTARIATIEPS